MDSGVAVILKMVIPVLKMVTRVRLAIFDQFMRLGPNLGPLAMVIGWIASMFACLLGVSRLVRAGADEIFVVLAFSMGALQFHSYVMAWKSFEKTDSGRCLANGLTAMMCDFSAGAKLGRQ